MAVNLLDQALAYLAPGLALKRHAARQALATLRAFDAGRSYDAGKSTRRTDGWRSSGASANVETGSSLATTRNRSRELVRNNPYAKRAIDTLVAKSIGTGIRARWDKGAASAWKEFVETCDLEGDTDLYGLQTLMARSAYESGEVIVRRIRLAKGRVPLKLQILESDYLDSTRFGLQASGNLAIAGVEVDALGRRVAYWLWDQHPGGVGFFPRGLTSKRVDASEVILFGEKQRPGQVRFMPRLAASMMRLRDLDDYRDALIVKKKIEACFAVFVMGGNGSAPLGEATTDTSTGKRTETLSPGIIEYVQNGTDVKFANPSAGGDDGFTNLELHAIAAGAGITYEQLTGDLSQVNYSSIRAGQQDFRDLVDTWRWTSFCPMGLRRIGEWFLDAAWTAGSIRAQTYGVQWTAPKWPYVDPLKDVEADKLEMRMGTKSLSEGLRERGYDPDEVFAEIKKEREQLKKDGIVVDSNAEVGSQAAASTTEPATDPAAVGGKVAGAAKK